MSTIPERCLSGRGSGPHGMPWMVLSAGPFVRRADGCRRAPRPFSSATPLRRGRAGGERRSPVGRLLPHRGGCKAWKRRPTRRPRLHTDHRAWPRCGGHARGSSPRWPRTSWRGRPPRRLSDRCPRQRPKRSSKQCAPRSMPRCPQHRRSPPTGRTIRICRLVRRRRGWTDRGIPTKAFRRRVPQRFCLFPLAMHRGRRWSKRRPALASSMHSFRNPRRISSFSASPLRFATIPL